MRAFLAVLQREIVERRLLVLVAALAGLFPLAVPLLPGTSGHTPSDLRGGAALVLALAFSVLFALGLGATVLAGDLSERRLGFYFSRPLPGWTVWSGKLLAAFLLVLAAGLLVLVPALLLDGSIDMGVSPGAGAVLAPMAVLLLLLLAHAVSVMVRSRSPWLVLDVAALFLLGSAAWGLAGLLLGKGAYDAFNDSLAGFVAAVLLAGALAGAVQVIRGRTDLRRGHRLLSLTFWSTLGIALLILGGYARWIFAAGPGDLSAIEAVPAPSGSWIGVRGEGRGGHHPTFLLDVASGRYAGLDVDVSSWWLSPVFSADGKTAAWVEGEARSPVLELSTLDLSRPGASPVRAPVSWERPLRSIALSPDGTRIAAVHGDKLTVDDLAAGRLLASIALPHRKSDRPAVLRFAGPGRLRVFTPSRDGAWQWTVVDVDLASGRIAQSRQIEIPQEVWDWRVDRDAERILFRGSLRDTARLLDLRKGDQPVDLHEETTGMDFLQDGRIVLAGREGRGSALRILSADGATELRRIPFAAPRLVIGGQPLPGHLTVARISDDRHGGSADRASLLVDLETGRKREIGRGLQPMVRTATPPDSVASRLFYGKGGRLLLLDPATGKLRPL